MSGHELRKLRKKIGLTQADLAAIIGVTVTTISRWENSIRPIGEFTEIAIRQKLAAWTAG